MTIGCRVKKFMGEIATWLSRATGIGYHSPAPQLQEIIRKKRPERLARHAERVRQVAEELERELVDRR